MLKISFIICFYSCFGLCFGQDVLSTSQYSPSNDYENIHVERIAGDSLITSFMIWIKDTVKTHKHEWHSETVYTLEGEGIIYFNDSTQQILTKGSIVFIPKGTWHAVKVTSEEPMQVLSVQSPGFYGEDRIFKPLKK